MNDEYNHGRLDYFLGSFIGKFAIYVLSVFLIIFNVAVIPGVKLKLSYLLFSFPGFVGIVLHLITFSYWYVAWSSSIPKSVVIGFVVATLLQLIGSW